MQHYQDFFRYHTTHTALSGHRFLFGRRHSRGYNPCQLFPFRTVHISYNYSRIVFQEFEIETVI